MAASAVELFLEQVRVALLGATSAGTLVERGRPDPFDRAELPALNIRRGRVETSEMGQSMDHSIISFEIDIEVRGSDWETIADALHVEIDTALTNNAPLLAMVRGLRATGTDPTAEGGDDTAGRITARYQAQILTRRGDMTRQLT